MLKIGHFPDYVNENAARWVAFFVVILTAVSIFFPRFFFVVPLSLGFFARTLYGPKILTHSPVCLENNNSFSKNFQQRSPWSTQKIRTIGWFPFFIYCYMSFMDESFICLSNFFKYLAIFCIFRILFWILCRMLCIWLNDENWYHTTRSLRKMQ